MSGADSLNRVLHATVNSVVQYLTISDPYVPPGFDRMDEILAIRDAEVRQAHEITDLMLSLDANPKVGIFDYWNVDLNYLDVRFMTRFAAAHQEKVIADLEAALEAVRDDPASRALLTRLLEEKRDHLETLRDIGGLNEPEPETPESRTDADAAPG